MTALAIEAFAPPMDYFRKGRDFAAWLGLVPRQFSSGGEERLGRLSNAGQADIRKLLKLGLCRVLTGWDGNPFRQARGWTEWQRENQKCSWPSH